MTLRAEVSGRLASGPRNVILPSRIPTAPCGIGRSSRAVPSTRSTAEVFRIRRSNMRSLGDAGDFHAAFASHRNRPFVAGVGMAKNAHRRIRSEHATDAPGGLLGAVRDNHLPGVERVPNAHATAMMERDPGRAVHR